VCHFFADLLLASTCIFVCIGRERIVDFTPSLGSSGGVDRYDEHDCSEGGACQAPLRDDEDNAESNADIYRVQILDDSSHEQRVLYQRIPARRDQLFLGRGFLHACLWPPATRGARGIC